MSNERFDSVWDAIENTPAEATNMKLRSALMMALKEHIARTGLSQSQAAKLFSRSHAPRGNAGRALSVRSWDWTQSARTCSHAGAWEPEDDLACSGTYPTIKHQNGPKTAASQVE